MVDFSEALTSLTRALADLPVSPFETGPAGAAPALPASLLDLDVRRITDRLTFEISCLRFAQPGPPQNQGAVFSNFDTFLNPGVYQARKMTGELEPLLAGHPEEARLKVVFNSLRGAFEEAQARHLEWIQGARRGESFLAGVAEDAAVARFHAAVHDATLVAATLRTNAQACLTARGSGLDVIGALWGIAPRLRTFAFPALGLLLGFLLVTGATRSA